MPASHRSGLLRIGDFFDVRDRSRSGVYQQRLVNVQALVGKTVQFAAGGAAALEARLRGPKLVTIANPLTLLASNLVSHPDIKKIADLKGKWARTRALHRLRIQDCGICSARTG